MEICVIGTGYVGLVAGTCLADLGFRVVCVDRDQAKISGLNVGVVPIYEPGLEPLIKRNVRERRLIFTTDGDASIADADVVFIAVGTPGLPDGRADVSGVLAVAEQIGRNMSRPTVAVIKSTVPVGTADKVREAIGRHARFDYDVVSNPEFLKEGAAVQDFKRPDRIVVGCATERARTVMQRLYKGLVRTGKPIYFMDNRSAELTKYASNAMLATRISFMNELSRLCERVGADVEMVRRGTGSDSRIGPRFLFPGVGYGGSCFPKDVNALIQTAADADLHLEIASAVVQVNDSQKHVLADKVIAHYGDDLKGRRLAVWGLAFKPETDDMREAPAVVIIERLLELGVEIVAYDPEAGTTAYAVLGDRISYAKTPLDAVDGADALLLVTEWNEFRNLELDDLRERLKEPVIFDGRNIYEPERLRSEGFTYYGIGRH